MFPEQKEYRSFSPALNPCHEPFDIHQAGSAFHSRERAQDVVA